KLYNLYTYTNDFPFTGDALASIPVPAPSGTSPVNFEATENWAAFVNGAQWGVGVFHRGVYRFLGGFGGSSNGTPTSADYGYISPVRREIIDYNIVYEYEYALVLGTLTEIRNYAYQNQPDPFPNYQFAQDRQHWITFNATDMGFPIVGSWRVNMDQVDPSLVGPPALWPAVSVPH